MVGQWAKSRSRDPNRPKVNNTCFFVSITSLGRPPCSQLFWVTTSLRKGWRVKKAVWIVTGVPSRKVGFRWKNLEAGFDSKIENILANRHYKGIICRWCNNSEVCIDAWQIPMGFCALSRHHETFVP
ncbi:unnamed protein product [Gadus morhua 'NCC']